MKAHKAFKLQSSYMFWSRGMIEQPRFSGFAVHVAVDVTKDLIGYEEIYIAYWLYGEEETI